MGFEEEHNQEGKQSEHLPGHNIFAIFLHPSVLIDWKLDPHKGKQ